MKQDVYCQYCRKYIKTIFSNTKEIDACYDCKEKRKMKKRIIIIVFVVLAIGCMKQINNNQSPECENECEEEQQIIECYCP